jgi:hypothetical protein
MRNRDRFVLGHVAVCLLLAAACGHDTSLPPPPSRLGATRAALAPTPPSSTAPDAGTVAWVSQVVPALLGRPVRSFGELKFLSVMTVRYGKAVVVEGLMNNPAFVDRWSGVMLDRLRIDRFETPGAPADAHDQEGCFRTPLLTYPDAQAAAAQIVLHTQRAGQWSADPTPAGPSPGTYNMADIVRGSLLIDNVFPIYRGFLFSLATHRDVFPADDTNLAADTANETSAVGSHFAQTFLNKSPVCTQCHNTEQSCSGPDLSHFVPQYPNWPRYHELAVGFSPEAHPGLDPSWASSFDSNGYTAGTGPFPGWSSNACGNAGSDVSVRPPPGAAPLLARRGNVWQLDAALKDGYLAVNTLVSSGAINNAYSGAPAAAIDGRTVGVYWLATAFTDDIWRELFGAPLTIPNYMYRNTDAQDLAWSLAEQSVIANGWSLRALLRDILTSHYFNRTVSGAPQMPQFFQPFLHPEGPYAQDFVGDAVHRRSADLLFRMKTAVLEEQTADAVGNEIPYLSEFPYSSDPANPPYPTRDDALAMSLYLSSAHASPPTPIMSQIGMLDWEASAGQCERPASVAWDWLDLLALRAVNPGITIRDAIDALRYRALGGGITHTPQSTNPAAVQPDGTILSEEEMALQTYLGRSIRGTFTDAGDAARTLRNVCASLLKTPHFLLEGVPEELETVDFTSPPSLQVGDMYGPNYLAGTPPGLNSDTPTDACNSWEYEFRRVIPRYATWDCTTVEFPPHIHWESICPAGRCDYIDWSQFHPPVCELCPGGSQWVASLPPIDARVEYTPVPEEPVRSGMFLLWTENASVAYVIGQAQIVRANGKVEPGMQAGASLAVGDAVELWPGGQLKLVAADGTVFATPDGGMPKTPDGGTWLFKATGKSALVPPSMYQPQQMSEAAAAAMLESAREAALNEEPGSVSFLHNVTSPYGDSSYLSDPTLTDAKRVVLVSQVYAGTADNAAVGAWFTGSTWAIYNEDGSPMPTGAAFSVRSMAPSTTAFVHTTTSSNTNAHITYIDDAPTVAGTSVLDGLPSEAIQVTHVWNAPGLGGVYNNHPVGVYYDGVRWAIYNEDFAPMPVGTAFAVKLGGTEVITSNAVTQYAGGLAIDDPSTNGFPGAHLFLTHDWNPPGAPAMYYSKRVATAYDTKLGRWNIVNLDGSPIPTGVSFNVHRSY